MLRDKPKGFYIDYPFPETVPANVPTYTHVEALFEANRKNFSSLISSFSTTINDLQLHVSSGNVPWQSPGQFPQLDIVSAYCMVRECQPASIIEIGSGTSTFVLSSALQDNGTGRLKCIDPEPRRDINGLDIDFERRLLSVDDVTIVGRLRANDILFIDSSHLFLPGSDVDIEFNRLFPELPTGCLVHVHDIFLPDGYPEDWHRRHYAEQNALIGWILSGYFEVVYPGYFAATRMVDELADGLGDLMPIKPEKSAGSIWLRKL